MKTVPQIIRDAERNYTKGNTKLGDYVDWNMHDTIERIDAYLNSKHISGSVDNLGREKPFFNIVSAAVNIWYRATDIDRKDIKFIPTSRASVPLAFIANALLQKWMDKARYGQFLNQWGRALVRYGSADVKHVEKNGDLIASVVPWNRIIADPVQYDALPKIEKFYLTPAQLRTHTEYDQDVVDKLIQATIARKTVNGNQKDNQNDFIELYEVHGELDTRLLQDDPDLNIEDKDIKYRQQMHVVSYVEAAGGEYDDFTLFKGKEARDPRMITHLIEEDGRTLAIGAVEYLFDSQWMMNHTVKNMKDTLDMASKLIFQTADTSYVNRNVLTELETGDIFIFDGTKAPNGLQRIGNDKPDIAALQNFGSMWRSLSQDLTSTPDALRGNTLPSSTPYALGALLSNNADSLFEIMIENKALALEDMIRTYVIPHLKKQLKNRDEIVAILDDAGVAEIDAMFIPKEAIRRHNDMAINTVLQGPGNVPPAFDPQSAQNEVAQELNQTGNKRFFKPDELDEKDWEAIFSDFEWDSIKIQISNENNDQRAALQTLSTVLQTLATNPMVLQDPNARMVFSEILKQTGVLSPIQLSPMSATPAMAPQNQPQPALPPSPGGGITSNQLA